MQGRAAKASHETRIAHTCAAAKDESSVEPQLSCLHLSISFRLFSSALLSISPALVSLSLSLARLDVSLLLLQWLRSLSLSASAIFLTHFPVLQRLHLSATRRSPHLT